MPIKSTSSNKIENKQCLRMKRRKNEDLKRLFCKWTRETRTIWQVTIYLMSSDRINSTRSTYHHLSSGVTMTQNQWLKKETQWSSWMKSSIVISFKICLRVKRSTRFQRTKSRATLRRLIKSSPSLEVNLRSCLRSRIYLDKSSRGSKKELSKQNKHRTISQRNQPIYVQATPKSYFICKNKRLQVKTQINLNL